MKYQQIEIWLDILIKIPILFMCIQHIEAEKLAAIFLNFLTENYVLIQRTFKWLERVYFFFSKEYFLMLKADIFRAYQNVLMLYLRALPHQVSTLIDLVVWDFCLAICLNMISEDYFVVYRDFIWTVSHLFNNRDFVI